MSDEDLRRAIARLAGLRLEPGLIDLVLRDVAGEPGALPLMSHALRETWERRDGRTLTVEAYQESGGVQLGRGEDGRCSGRRDCGVRPVVAAERVPAPDRDR
jgi:Novel STAND NTPase 1